MTPQALWCSFIGIDVECYVATMRTTTAVLALTSLFALVGCSSGFQPADIDEVKKSIRAEFSKNDQFEVTEVVMLKETSTKLNGFVKLHNRIIGDITKPCSATMAEDGRNFIWQCR